MEPSCIHLGAVVGRLGAVLEPSWGGLAAPRSLQDGPRGLQNDPEGLKKLPESSKCFFTTFSLFYLLLRRRCGIAKISILSSCDMFSFLTRLGASWRYFGANLGRLGGVLGSPKRFWAALEVPRALLEPPRAVLEALLCCLGGLRVRLGARAARPEPHRRPREPPWGGTTACAEGVPPGPRPLACIYIIDALLGGAPHPPDPPGLKIYGRLNY